MFYITDVKGLESIYGSLKETFQIISPTLKDGVLLYSEEGDFNSLPFGYTQMEGPSFYQLLQSPGRHFTYLRPSNTLKFFLRPPNMKLLSVKRSNGELSFEYHINQKKLAFFDVRRCDLKALQTLDNVYLNNRFPDPYYKVLRENIFLVGVDCQTASDVCFCHCMGVDLEDSYGADIFITELDGRFLVTALSKRAVELVEKLHIKEASVEDIQKAKEKRERLLSTFKKHLDTKDLKENLYRSIENPYWEEIGKRCLSCTNCTQVCPTCFCFDIKEVNCVELDLSERVVSWDSCFNQTFATVHKFNIRDTIASRYRQWLMHKMAYWQDQFGEFGCVGCGRCITWCPAKIDIQVETAKLREL